MKGFFVAIQKWNLPCYSRKKKNSKMAFLMQANTLKRYL